MKRLIHFFSLAVMTQVILMLSQLILLPLQIRLWGQSETALWYSALAIATMTYFVDCGLRTAGHAELMNSHLDPQAFPSEALQFRQIWTWIRLLVFFVTALLILLDFLASLVQSSHVYAFWHPVLILACALETVLIIRITYLDSLGKYRGAEASYFCFAMLRLLLSVPMLVVFHWHAPGLAVVYFFTAALALLVQGQWLCTPTSLLHLTAKFSAPSWKTLALARHTVAEPLANWARLSLPVLVIAQIAPPMAVTTYVALRAVFGAGRTAVLQLARVASVELLKSKTQGRLHRAESLLSVFLLAAICFGSSVAFFVVIDNLRLLGLWLKHFNLDLFQQVALAFSLTAPFFSYQIPMNLMFRTGKLAAVARPHYSFIACSILFAASSMAFKSLPAYLCLLVVAEVVLSASFFVGTSSGALALRWAAGSSTAIGILWLAVHLNLGALFLQAASAPLVASTLLLVGLISVLISSCYFLHRSDLSIIRTEAKVEPSPAFAD